MGTQTVTLADKAYGIIEGMIVTLQLQPGSVLSEGQLSQAIKIGRTPMREALQRLSAEGLVESLPRRGVMVSEINIAQHLALLETRRVLDRLLIMKAARRATTDQRESLKTYALLMHAAASNQQLSEFMHLDREADVIIEAAARNSFAARALAPLHTQCRRFWYMYHQNGDIVHSANMHMQVVQAIIDGDEKAAASASDGLVDYLEQFTRAAFDL